MAKYLDNDGLLYLWQKIKTKFATITDLDGKVDKVTGKGLSTNDYTTAEKNKLKDVASGAQVNVIETVKVNNTALTPSSKAVNITVPTKTSDITNDSGFITSADIPEGAAASTTTPKMNGTAAVGTEMAFARGDHVHPSDTSRVPTTRKVAGHALSADVTLAKSDVGLGNVDNTADADKPISTAQQTALDNKVDKVTGKGLSTNDYTTDEKNKLSGIEAGAQVNPQVAIDGHARKISGYSVNDDMGALIMVYDDGSSDGGIIGVPLASAAQEAIGSLSNALAGKADADSVYTKSDVYTKTETDTALNGKLDKSDEYGLIKKASVDYGYDLAIKTGNTIDHFIVVNLDSFNTTMQQATEIINGKANASDLENYALKSDITNMYKYKGSVATVSALPSSDNTTGDVYNVETTGMNYAWNGTAWDALGEIFTITSISNSDIDTIVAS